MLNSPNEWGKEGIYVFKCRDYLTGEHEAIWLIWGCSALGQTSNRGDFTVAPLAGI